MSFLFAVVGAELQPYLLYELYNRVVSKLDIIFFTFIFCLLSMRMEIG